MGKRNRQRRAAKAKERAKASAGRHDRGERSQPWGPPHSDRERAGMVLMAAVDARLREAPSEAALLAQLARLDLGLVARHAEDELRRALPRLWDFGWQPAEIVRQARRLTARAGRWVAAGVLADHARRHPSTLHPRWRAQIDELRAGAEPAAHDRPGWLADLARHDGLGHDAAIAAIVDALAACFGVGPIGVLLPPPGTDAAPEADRAAPRNVDDSVLAKVRALLAQAESTTFEAEAATFTAKAQELMARHSLDRAMLWHRVGRDEAPSTIRVPIDDPYADTKSLLLHFVAESFRCRAILLDRYALCSVVGFASDLASAEVLFTSLLVQAQVALQAEAAAAPAGSRVRSRSFRTSFLLAYAHRIDERLAAVNHDVESQATSASTEGGSLLPVLAARSDAVDDAVAEQFGELATTMVRGGNDAVGWSRGRLAADRAQLTFGDLEHEACA